jgi:hypothetical protein
MVELRRRKMKKIAVLGIAIALLSVTAIFAAEKPKVISDSEEVKALIQKLDSDNLQERTDAYNKLLELAKKDKSVLEIIKQEVQNQNTTANTKYLLQRIINAIEKPQQEEEKNKPSTESRNAHQITLPGGGVVRVFTIPANPPKPNLGIEGIDLSNQENIKNALAAINHIFGKKYENVDEFLKDILPPQQAPKGVFVTHIAHASPAMNIIELGDVILKVDSHDITSSADLKDVLEKHYSIGDKVKLTIIRKKATSQVEVTLSPFAVGGQPVTETIIRALQERALQETEKIGESSKKNIEDVGRKLEEITMKLKEIEEKINNILEKLQKLEEKQR